MKEHPILFSAPMVRALLADRKHVTRRLSKQWLKVKAGDRLWVRETWTGTWCYEDMHLVYAADGSERTLSVPEVPRDYCLPKAAIKPGAWVSPFFLPRWACRIVLECEEDARPERLQDITEEDAVLEGCEETPITDADIREALENPMDESKAKPDGRKQGADGGARSWNDYRQSGLHDALG